MYNVENNNTFLRLLTCKRILDNSENKKSPTKPPSKDCIVHLSFWMAFFQFLMQIFSDSPDFFPSFNAFLESNQVFFMLQTPQVIFLFNWKWLSGRIEYLNLEFLLFFQILKIQKKKNAFRVKTRPFFPWNCSINFIIVKDVSLTENGTLTFLKSGQNLNQIRFSQFFLLRGELVALLNYSFLSKIHWFSH